MYLDMLCKIRFFVKSLLTVTALMWFSPVCILIYITRVPSHANTFSQWVHWCVLSPVCIYIWYIGSLLSTKAISEWLQGCGSPMCVSWYDLNVKIIFNWKFLLTLYTLIWFLPCVYHDVIFQINTTYLRRPTFMTSTQPRGWWRLRAFYSFL